MPSWIDNLRDKERQAKLAREMTHTTRAPIESLRGQDPLTDWAIGMQQRATSPLATLAGEAKRFQGLSPQEMGMELAGGGMAGAIGKAGKAAKTSFERAHNIAQKNAALPIEKGGLGLPADNTAMDRAKSLGFDIPAYHGTSKNFDSFNMGGSGKTSGTGAFFSDNPHVSSSYSSKDGGNVIPVMIKAQSPVQVETKGANWSGIGKNVKVNAPKISFTDKDADRIMFELTGDSEPTLRKRAAFKKTVGKLFENNFKYDDYLSSDDLARWANKQGYESMIFDSIKDRGPEGIFHTSESALPSKNTVIFNPSNIRSRFAAFDPMQRNSANILAGGAAGAVGLSSLAYPYGDKYQ